MEPPIIPFDLHRMFLGDAPPLFYLEIVVRCLVIYVWTLLLLRWIGGRSVAQLSLIEFLLVIALGSAVGDALFYPEVPLLHAMLVILVVVLVNKAIDLGILRWTLVKRVVDGDPVRLMQDGRILGGSVGHRTMGTGELTAALRARGVRNLGEIESVYMESNGSLAVFRRPEPQPGLRIAPPLELEAPPCIAAGAGGTLCCTGCGKLQAAVALGPDRSCPECGSVDWTRPVL